MHTLDNRSTPSSRKQTPGEPARSEAVRTIARGEDILDQAKEVARAIDERIHNLVGRGRDRSASYHSEDTDA